jgi:hypothetical protein
MGSQARVYHTQQIHYIEKTLTFDSGVVTIGTIPAGAHIVKPISGAAVNVAFNAGTTNVIDIGTTANDDLFATDLAGGTIAFVPFDEAVTQLVAAETTFTATYAQTGTAATAGSARVMICYIP